jgi:hypothetical protein
MKQKKIKIVRRLANLKDVDSIVKLDNEVWPDFPATRDMIESRIRVFPEGNFVAIYNGEIVGYVCMQFINYDIRNPKAFSWLEITSNGTLKDTHMIDGEVVYGVATTVSPKMQNMNIGTYLALSGWMQGIRYNKKGFMFGCKMPDYQQVKDKYTPEDYIKLRRPDGKLFDKELRLMEREGFSLIRVLPGYENDPESCNYGVLVWQKNPFYNRGWSGLRNSIAWAIFTWGPKIFGLV